MEEDGERAAEAWVGLVKTALTRQCWGAIIGFSDITRFVSE
jgi:hypothetical protein